MRRTLAAVLGAALVVAIPAAATAAPKNDNGKKPGATAPVPGPDADHGRDDKPSPLSDKQRKQRKAAVEQVMQGQKTPRGDNKVVQVAPGQFVELAQEDTDGIWTVLGDFADVQHNSIPEPDRAVDNTTIWTEDFSREHFDQMLFDSSAGVNSVANFYEELSSGRYSVTGEVEDWVEVPEDGAYYGDNAKGDAMAWEFLNDTLTAWYAEQRKTKTVDQIDAYLAQFDVWDRYDHDGDGNFDEADGYIDHFQAVHAGMGEEVGGGVLGDDAIWSHRWYNQTNRIGTAGPAVVGKVVPYGGAPVGGSKYWIGDYTIEPENGGVGVFAHEFAHDLGLPDLYDTSGNSGGAENSTGFWSLMSSGSYGNTGLPADGIGTKPVHMGAWEKLQLGWLNYEVVPAGETRGVKLGPASTNTRQAQSVIALLPDRQVPLDLGAPYEGTDYWYSGSGDDLDVSMLTPKPADAEVLAAKVRYDIEVDWDYAYAVYSTDGGATFTSLPTDRSTTTDPNQQNFGHGITGDTDGQWVDLTASLSSVPPGALVGFRYWTDVAVSEPGFMVDAVTIDSVPVTSWTLDGFSVTTGSGTQAFFNAYIAENRTYRGYDAGLQTGPYNFGDPTKPDWAERLPYQDGVLVSYWNSQYGDNNVGDHPGAGLILPVDAHPELLVEPTTDGAEGGKGPTWRPRIQSMDSTFGLERTDEVTLHDPESGAPGAYGGLPAVPVFDDTKDWYVSATDRPDAQGWNGVDVPKTGTSIRVISTSIDGFIEVVVS